MLGDKDAISGKKTAKERWRPKLMGRGLETISLHKQDKQSNAKKQVKTLRSTKPGQSRYYNYSSIDMLPPFSVKPLSLSSSSYA